MNEANEEVLKGYEEKERAVLAEQVNIQRVVAEALDAAGYAFTEISVEADERANPEDCYGGRGQVKRLEVTIQSLPFMKGEKVRQWPIEGTV